MSFSRKETYFGLLLDVLWHSYFVATPSSTRAYGLLFFFELRQWSFSRVLIRDKPTGPTILLFIANMVDGSVALLFPTIG